MNLAGLLPYVMPVVIGLVVVLLLNAIGVAGAGGVYFSGGGLDAWELPFGALMLYVAYRGLTSWTFIGIGWLLHTAWDVVHHLKGSPILPFAHDSSLGCAICDPVIALWCLRGGPPLRELLPGRRAPQERVVT
ncbi:DUF6010 family protein [Streptomyces scabiei]|uniref:DUF6010 family protein n=1 Tax=Streptomyces scabiei TaxID=1930 RepID=UPI0039EFF91A